MKSVIFVGLLACAPLTAQANPANDLCQVSAKMLKAVAVAYVEAKDDPHADADKNSIAAVRAIAEAEVGKCIRRGSLFNGWACSYYLDAPRIASVGGRFVANYPGEDVQLVRDMYAVAQRGCGKGPGMGGVEGPMTAVSDVTFKWAFAPHRKTSTQSKDWQRSDKTLMEDYRMAPSAAKVISVYSLYTIHDNVGQRPVTLTFIEQGDISGPKGADVVDIDLSALGSLAGMDEGCTMEAEYIAADKRSRSGWVEATRWDNTVSTSDPKLTSFVKSAKAFAVYFECKKPKIMGHARYSPSNTYSAAVK